MTVELTEFLLARITEDEASVVGISCECEGSDLDRLPSCPDRVLAECEAKRRIVGSFSWYQENAGRGTASYDALLLAERHALLLASVYADHPDYRDEWRP